MRKSVMCVGLALLFGAALQLRAQQPDEARAVVAKAIEAHGGAEKLAAIKAVVIKGKGKISIAGMDLTFTMDSSVQLPGKMRNVIEVDAGGMNFTLTQVYNGKKGWVNVMGKTMDLDEKQMKEAHAMMEVEKVTSLHALLGKGYKLEPLGEVKVGDTDAVGVRVTKEGTREVNLYFEKKTHLLRKAEYQGADPTNMMEVRQEKLFPEYRDQNGIKMPSKLVINNDGKRFLEMDVSETTVVDRHDDTLFAKP